MQLEQNPMFRKNPIPRYDSTPACIIAAGLMIGLCLFGGIGIRVAATHPPYRWFIWVPVLLTTLSAGVLVSLIVRLIRRKNGR